MKRMLAYTRVSTLKQGEGVSLEAQQDAISQYAQKNGLTIHRWYSEQVTAAKQGRKEFTKMLTSLRKGEADGLIMHKIDRSARNLRDWAELGDLIDQGYDVHFAHESLDLHARGGRLSADIQAVIAADYIRNLREETRKGFYGRLKQGILPLSAPLGYLDTGKGKLKAIDPVRAPYIKQAFELYATGNYSLNTLSKELYRSGLRNKCGNPVRKNHLSLILRNPFYTGLIKVRTTGETFNGIHEPLITTKLFGKVQDRLDGKMMVKKTVHPFLFRKLFRCHHCHTAMIGEKQKGRVYYRCQTKECPTKTIREDVLEDQIMNFLSVLKMPKIQYDELSAIIKQRQTDQYNDRDKIVASIDLQLAALEKRRERLTDAYIDRMIEKDDFDNRKAALLAEANTLEQEKKRIDGSFVNLADKISEILELANSALLGFKRGMLDEKRQLLEKLTSNRTIEGKNALVSVKFPYDRFIDFNGVLQCALHRDRSRTLTVNCGKLNTQSSQNSQKIKDPRATAHALLQELTIYYSRESGSGKAIYS